MTQLTEVVKALIESGEDPNSLQKEFEQTVRSTGRWAIWGDGKWRLAMVCSKCGSFYIGICADEGTPPDLLDSKNPVFHKNQPGVTTIPWLDWKARKKQNA